MPDINQRIVLTGAEEVRRGLDQIAAAGQRSGNLTRQALLAALGPTSDFTAGINAASEAHAGLSAQGQAAFHSMRSVTEQLALGVSPAQALTQQLNHLSFAATGPGGVSGAFGELLAIVRGFVTPTTAAIGVVAAFAAGIAALTLRAQGSEDAARKFQAILDVTGQRSQITGKRLEEIAESFHKVGLSTVDAREQITKFLDAGGKGRNVEQVLRIGAKLRDIFGQDAMQEFLNAAAQGGKPLEDFAKKLGVVPGIAEDTSKQLDAAAEATRKFNDSVADILRNRSRSLEEVERNRLRQIADLTRVRGTPEQEINLQARRAAEDIERQTTQRLLDLQRQRNDQLAQERAAALAKYNADITAAAQAALDTGTGLLAQIEQALDRTKPPLNAFQQAVRDMSAAWNDFLDTLSKSDFIQSILNGLTSLITGIKDVITWIDNLSTAIRNIPNLPSWLGGSGGGPSNLAFAPFTGITGLFAEGGLVRGPGGPTGDKIPARLSDFEFVSRARSVQIIGADVYAALNAFPERFANLRQLLAGVRHFADGGLATISDRVHEAIAVPSFATGGLVTASAAGGTAVHLHLDGRSFQLRGEQNVVDALEREVRHQKLRRTGVLPGFKS